MKREFFKEKFEEYIFVVYYHQSILILKNILEALPEMFQWSLDFDGHGRKDFIKI